MMFRKGDIVWHHDSPTYCFIVEAVEFRVTEGANHEVMLRVIGYSAWYPAKYFFHATWTFAGPIRSDNMRRLRHG